MNIIQIIQADPRWKAIYKSNDKETAIVSNTLACWAIVEDDRGNRFVTGMDGENEQTIEPCLGATEFKYYEFHQQP